ncbi:signal peptidase II [Leucobacter luti]|uniref:Lipoprotein signal peptidase n=1 Tax=Leucobacter luti TaxID=340320 RepID=A0A4R6RZN5_9MICO|nr:signal peptidase II [Leucobacter luti]MCW2287582.1 signal peptidase II [Leucobacter luti]TCK46250.1 signal peptidase II [Leucobacter luti]TDP92679.1 signal peptidase II [Leucobacter luti]
MNDVTGSADDHVTPDATATRPWRRWVPAIVFAVALVVLAADQSVKNWVVSHLDEGVTVQVIGDVLRWHFVRNPGAAFSMASGSTWIFTILAAVVVVVILWQIRRLRSVPWALFLGLLLGGVLGNLTDRLTREPGFPEGHVIDFISTPWMWLGFNEAIYNIADIGIVSGMILFILITLLGLPIDGRSRAQAKADEAAAEAAKHATAVAGTDPAVSGSARPNDESPEEPGNAAS